MTPQFRFTIFNDPLYLSGIVVSQPAGWEDIQIVLERNVYHSLTESIVADTLIWFSDARDVFREIEDDQGPDAEIRILAEIKFDDNTYETFFDGIVDLSTIQDIDIDMRGPYKCTVSIREVSTWSKFMNRINNSVDLQSTTDLDGNITEAINPSTISLTPQKVRQQFVGTTGIPDPFSFKLVEYDVIAGSYGGIDVFNALTLDEIEKRLSVDNNSPEGGAEVQTLFALKFAGTYVWNITLYVCGTNLLYQLDPDVSMYFQRNNGTPVALTRTDYGTDSVDGVTGFVFSDTIDHIAGEKIRIFFKNNNAFSVTKHVIIIINNAIAGFPTTNSMSIVANTVFPATPCESFRIHEAFNAVTDRIVGRNLTFYSEYLGNPDTQQMTYADFGCGSAYALFKGINARGYSLLSKPFSASFTDLWGAEAVLNLGLGLFKLPSPIYVQFLKNPELAHFDSQFDWTSIGNPAYEIWSENGDGQASVSIIIAMGFPDLALTQYLSQIFAIKLAGGSYKVSLAYYMSNAGSVVHFVLETYLAGVLQETLYSSNRTSIGGDSFDVTFTAVDDFDEIRLSLQGISVSVGTTIDFRFSRPDTTGYGLFGFYELIQPTVLRCEPKRHFYNTTPSLLISGAKLIRTYANEVIYKSLEIGYAKGAVQSQSGIDDPQISHKYNTANRMTGTDLKIISSLVAASLAIEQTRRQQSLEIGKDWQLDNDIMIVALNKSSLDVPELDENFSSITNLLNPETRYNTRLSVGYMMTRWMDFLNGTIQWMSAGLFYYFFGSGKGNFDMQSELDGGDCESAGFVNEKADVNGSSDFLYKPVQYNYASCPMTWSDYKTVRDNPEKALGISRTDSGHKACHIKKLSYKPFHSVASIDVLLGETDLIP